MEMASVQLQQASKYLAMVADDSDDVRKQLCFFRRAGEILSAYRGRIPAKDAAMLAAQIVDIHGYAHEQQLKERQSKGSFTVSTVHPFITAANNTLEGDTIPMLRNVLAMNNQAIDKPLIKKLVKLGVDTDKPEETPLIQLLVDLVHRNRDAAEWAHDYLATKRGEAATWLKSKVANVLNEHGKAGNMSNTEGSSSMQASRSAFSQHPQHLLACHN